MARLVIVSNRVPIPKARVTAAGGLAVALRDLLTPGAMWFGWSGRLASAWVARSTTRKPRPGMIALNAVGWAMMSVNSISSMSPGWAPLTKTGPVSGCTTPASIEASSAALMPGVI